MIDLNVSTYSMMLRIFHNDSSVKRGNELWKSVFGRCRGIVPNVVIKAGYNVTIHLSLFCIHVLYMSRLGSDPFWIKNILKVDFI